MMSQHAVPSVSGAPKANVGASLVSLLYNSPVSSLHSLPQRVSADQSALKKVVNQS
jgi:hypothetical protein